MIVKARFNFRVCHLDAQRPSVTCRAPAGLLKAGWIPSKRNDRGALSFRYCARTL
jgi:hypothetical protein